MPGDLVISDPSVEPAPKDYTVPASQRFVVKQVQALFTDNGAAGDWLPALEIVSDAGIVTGRYVGESVGAGDGQEVTWFPLGRKGSAASGPPDCPFVLVFNQLGTSQAITTATDTDLSYASQELYTNDLTQTYYSSPSNTTVTINSGGTYLILANADYTDPGAYVAHTQIAFTTSGNNKSVLTSQVFKMAAAFFTSDVFPAGVSYGHTMHDILRIVDVPCTITLVTRQESGATKHVRNRGVAIYRLAEVGRFAPWP